eukprot:TRINITY_DN18319_c0_g1_i1.p1 TRINITY_DN18319_c0_g1~~TRINITY_DN18319_c0_g1_i1.p1  ORF type:complete len:232 (+),score=71.00 TRINITY_DN18319_c0_g1_i1:169-864(+)
MCIRDSLTAVPVVLPTDGLTGLHLMLVEREDDDCLPLQPLEARSIVAKVVVRAQWDGEQHVMENSLGTMEPLVLGFESTFGLHDDLAIDACRLHLSVIDILHKRTNHQDILPMPLESRFVLRPLATIGSSQPVKLAVVLGERLKRPPLVRLIHFQVLKLYLVIHGKIVAGMSEELARVEESVEQNKTTEMEMEHSKLDKDDFEPTRLLSISYAVFCLKKKTRLPLATPIDP